MSFIHSAKRLLMCQQLLSALAPFKSRTESAAAEHDDSKQRTHVRFRTGFNKVHPVGAWKPLCGLGSTVTLVKEKKKK